MTTERLLAERLNVAPCIFRGCSSGELLVLAASASCVWLPLCVLLTWLAGSPGMGLGLAGVAIVANVVLGAGALARLKRGRPEGYYQHRVRLLLARAGVVRSPFIDRQGVWSLGRTDAPLP